MLQWAGDSILPNGSTRVLSSNEGSFLSLKNQDLQGVAMYSQVRRVIMNYVIPDESRRVIRRWRQNDMSAISTR